MVVGQMTDAELLDWVKAARARAHKQGSLSGLWDLIFDAEAHARGERAMFDRATVEQMIECDQRR